MRLLQQGQWGQTQQFLISSQGEIGHFCEFILHKVRMRVSVTVHHFLAAMSDALLDYPNRRARHNQGANPMVPQGMHPSTYQSEFAKYRMKTFISQDTAQARMPLSPQPKKPRTSSDVSTTLLTLANKGQKRDAPITPRLSFGPGSTTRALPRIAGLGCGLSTPVESSGTFQS